MTRERWTILLVVSAATAMLLTLAATLLSAGALADRIGRRAVFAWGLALFTACSVLCAAATSPVFLDLAA